jgi:hypothetical protein
MIEGGCYCGFVRYQADGPLSDETNCHCSICRRTSGAPFVSWVTVPLAGYRLLGGTPTTLRSSETATRTFCPRCGTPLTFAALDAPDQLDITIGSLDHPEAVPPKDNTWVSSKIAWLHLADGLPEYAEKREPE